MPVTVLVRSASEHKGDASRRSSGRGGEGPPSLTFDGTRIVIGRGSGSDVRLPDPSVSARHATIRASGTDYTIVDEASTNGTWVGGVQLAPHAPRVIKSGDLVRVGRVWLEIVLGQKAATPDLGLATRDLAFALVQRAMDSVGDDTIAKVRIAEGPDIGEELRLVEDGRAYVVGRSETCDFPLADVEASREHALIVRRGAQVLLRDLESRNGVLLGEVRLTPGRDVVWRAPMMARIGLTVLALDEPVSLALAELESAEDEAMRAEDAPPMPSSLSKPSANVPVAAVAETAIFSPSDDNPASRMSPATVAPIAEIADVPQEIAPVRQVKRAWTITDVLVVTLALGVIGASLAGLVWVLR